MPPAPRPPEPPPLVVLLVLDVLLEEVVAVLLVELVELVELVVELVLDPVVVGPLVVLEPVAPPAPLVVVPTVTSVRLPKLFGSRFSPCAQAPEFATKAKPTKATAKIRRILSAYVPSQSFLQAKWRQLALLIGTWRSSACEIGAEAMMCERVRAMKPARFALLALVAIFGWTARAWAHPVGVSSGVYAFEDGKLYAGLTFARREMADEANFGPWLTAKIGRA